MSARWGKPRKRAQLTDRAQCLVVAAVVLLAVFILPRLVLGLGVYVMEAF